MPKRKHDTANDAPTSTASGEPRRKRNAANAILARYTTTRIAYLRAICDLLKDFQHEVNIHFVAEKDGPPQATDPPAGIIINPSNVAPRRSSISASRWPASHHRPTSS